MGFVNTINGQVYFTKSTRGNDGIKKPESRSRIKKCKFKECKTKLNGFNIALENEYCCVHAVRGFLAEDKLKMGFKK